VVYYKATMSMSTAAVLKFTHEFTWPVLGLLLYQDNI